MISRTGVAVVVGLSLGFIVGLAWGRSTREQAAGHVKTDIHNGVVTIEVDAKQAVTDGLAGIVQQWSQ